MDMIHEFSFSASLKPPLEVGSGPIGTRLYYEITKGDDVSGQRLNGTVLGGGEWALIGPDGFLRPDVRIQVETHDGAHLYIQYTGFLEMNAVFQKAIESGAGTEYEDQYWYINPRIETGDERYAWLNTTFFIGEGRLRPGLRVEYKVWRPA